MSQQNNAGLIRLGLLALPLGGLLALVGQIAGYGSPDPGVDPTGAARYVVSTGFFVNIFVGQILFVTLTIFGVIALFACLANARGRGFAVGGMISSIVGIALALSAFGPIAYAYPTLAQAYLDGQQNALDLIDAIDGGTAGLVLVVSLFFTVGFILLGVAVWRSGVLPRWAGVLLGVQALLISVPLLPDPAGINQVVGAALLIVAGVWIFLSALRQPSGRVASPQAQPRVQ